MAIELRKQGISVGDPVYETHVSASVYQVSFRRLGGKILVRLTQEIPIGTIIIERQLWITDIEEMIEAAPRLVEALVHKKTIASTADIESVIESDTPMQRKIKGIPFGVWDFSELPSQVQISMPNSALRWVCLMRDPLML